MNMEKLGAEQERRKASFDELESLEGFAKLSDTQQKMIRVSLYSQDRTDRFQDPGRSAGYVASAERLYAWNCHAAGHHLENERSFGAAPEDRSWVGNTDADYVPERGPTLEAISQKIEQTGFPCVVVISQLDPSLPVQGNEILLSPAHTFVALGRNEQGDILCWDKEGANLAPFRLGPIDRIYKRYPGTPYLWGTRPLASPPDL